MIMDDDGDDGYSSVIITLRILSFESTYIYAKIIGSV